MRVLPFCRDAIRVFYSLSRIAHWNTNWESVSPLQRCIRGILQHPQANWATRTLTGGVLLLCRDAFGVFYSPHLQPNWLPGYSLEESYPPAEMQSVYFTAPPNPAKLIYSVWLSSEEMNKVTRFQILDEADCILHCTNTLGKGMNPIILPSSMSKLSYFVLIKQLV